MSFLGKRIFGRSARKGFNRQATFRRAKWGVYQLALVALILCIFAGIFDQALFHQIKRHWVSDRYVQTDARVTQSFYQNESGAKATKKITIEVRYWVGSQMFLTSDWGFPSLSNRRFAQATVDKYPVDSLVNVYYDPNNPKDVVLERGLRPIDLHTLMFIVPLNLAAILAVLCFWGVCIHPSGPTTKRKRYLKQRQRPWLMATGNAIVAAFAIVFIGPIAGIFYTGWFTDLHGSLTATLLTWAVILTLSLVSFAFVFVMTIKSNRKTSTP